MGANLLAGRTFLLDNGLLLEPRAAARYANVDIDGFSESGSSAALSTGSQRYEVGELGAGVRLAGNFASGSGNLQPELRLMAYQDLIGDQTASTSTFVLGGTPFATNGAEPARSSFEAGVGVDYRVGALTLTAGYDYLTKEDFNADTFTAKVRYDF
ncbi:outer membrane autotransporter barrel domain protein [compost metagenome]